MSELIVRLDPNLSEADAIEEVRRIVDMREYPMETMALWEASFNQDIWPEDFPVQPPDNLKGLGWSKGREMSSVCWKAISGRVPHKEFLRAHNVNLGPMTNAQFEQWDAGRARKWSQDERVAWFKSEGLWPKGI